MLKILEHLLYIIGMTWIENIEEATFARKKRMFEFNSLPCTCGNHICRLLITFAKCFVSPDLVPNCLQKLSADNISRQGVKRNFQNITGVMFLVQERGHCIVCLEQDTFIIA